MLFDQMEQKFNVGMKNNGILKYSYRVATNFSKYDRETDS